MSPSDSSCGCSPASTTPPAISDAPPAALDWPSGDGLRGVASRRPLTRELRADPDVYPVNDGPAPGRYGPAVAGR
eukprot:scaffold201055_cov29-Tisochrysis_lutea.AAC.19